MLEPGCFVGDLLVVEDEAGWRCVRDGLWLLRADCLLFQTLYEMQEARSLVGIS